MAANLKRLTLIFLLLFMASCQEQLPTDLPEEITDQTKTPPTKDDGDNGSIENPVAPKGVLKLGVFGDLNGSMGDPDYASTVSKGMKNILAEKFELILGTGDFTSGEDYRQRLPASRFPQMWASFERQILKPIVDSGTAFAPTPGNHDASIKRERVYYKDFWQSRTPNVNMVSTVGYPFYYSFTFKGVFFVSMDDVLTDDLPNRTTGGVTQREWIKEQLNSKIAQDSVARIVFGHVPLYPVLSKSKSGGKYYEILRNEQQGRKDNSLEEIFKNANVSLAVFGHSHAYYPGVVHHNSEPIEDSLNVLSMPCLGYGNRYLDQRTKSRSQRGYANINIDLATGKISYEVENFDGVIVQKSTLPESIKPYSNVTIKRNDLVEKIIN